MRYILQKTLYALSRAILRKYRPEVIGVTGSVGKTSVKEAIKVVLGGRFKVRASQANHNNEIGVPLAIIGLGSGDGSVIKWLKIFLEGLRLSLVRDPHYPEILVLEMAADHPGDLDYLTRLAPPRLGVVTAVSETHLEFFKTIKKVAKEKQVLVERLPKEGVAVLNADDALVAAMEETTRARVITFGLGAKAEMRLVEPVLKQEQVEGELKVSGLAGKLLHQGSAVPIFLPGVLGRPALYAAAAAAALGLVKGLNLLEISERLRLIAGAPGRLRLIPGIKHTTIIDDSYNSSPLAVNAALDLLREIKVEEQAERIVALGDMLELGAASEEAHRRLGAQVARLGFDFLVTVGQSARLIAEAARSGGLEENKIASFSTAEEAGRFLQNKIEVGDVLLIKGSQGVRMEKIVKELMAEPLRAEELLVRQYGPWLET